MVQIIAHTLVTAGHDVLILKRNQFEHGGRMLMPAIGICPVGVH